MITAGAVCAGASAAEGSSGGGGGPRRMTGDAVLVGAKSAADGSSSSAISSTSSCTAGRWPFDAARCTSVCPCASVVALSAPLATRWRISSVWPCRLAKLSGVMPPSVGRLTSATPSVGQLSPSSAASSETIEHTPSEQPHGDLTAEHADAEGLPSKLPAFLARMRWMIWRGKIRMDEHWEQGLEAYPMAVEKLFAGGHMGKLLVNVSAPATVAV